MRVENDIEQVAAAELQQDDHDDNGWAGPFNSRAELDQLAAHYVSRAFAELTAQVEAEGPEAEAALRHHRDRITTMYRECLAAQLDAIWSSHLREIGRQS